MSPIRRATRKQSHTCLSVLQTRVRWIRTPATWAAKARPSSPALPSPRQERVLVTRNRRIAIEAPPRRSRLAKCWGQGAQLERRPRNTHPGRAQPRVMQSQWRRRVWCTGVQGWLTIWDGWCSQTCAWRQRAAGAPAEQRPSSASCCRLTGRPRVRSWKEVADSTCTVVDHCDAADVHSCLRMLVLIRSKSQHSLTIVMLATSTASHREGS